MTSWTVLLVVLCSSLTPVLGCDWLRHYGHLSNMSLHLLHQMGGQLTEQDCPVPFPSKFYDRIRNATVMSQLVFIRDSLELIAGLYLHDNRSSVGWDTDKTERFLMTIHRQADGLNSCVLTNRRADSRLRKYYRRLETRTLYNTGGSAVSWELIRKESRRHLHQLDVLVACIRAAVASGRRCTT
ncbi:interferon phi 1 [Epinephelus lanceolatus]|uniref:interferon phi 1 n=1 Tax=Epinephelus lanceolatus TaxID=310571 RepID=UPI0014452446|nr:interferon phi 1 [Epinephelus lanceolatus]